MTATDATVRWKGTGHVVLADDVTPRPNALRFRLGPDNVIAPTANVKSPGEPIQGGACELELRRSTAGALKAYERLLGDALGGDPTMYARRDAVEESWRIVDEARCAAAPVHVYDEGTWGPKEAERVSPEGGFTNPEV